MTTHAWHSFGCTVLKSAPFEGTGLSAYSLQEILVPRTMPESKHGLLVLGASTGA